MPTSKTITSTVSTISADMNGRKQQRRSSLPDLYDFGRAPTLAVTTTSEVADADVGLVPDALAQEKAEQFVRAAIAFNLRAKQKRQAQNRIEAVPEPRCVEIHIAADELNITVDLAEGIVAELARLAASSGEVSGCAVQ